MYSRTPDERPPSPINDHPSHTTTFRVTDSGFCSYTNPSRATVPLIRTHQCDSEGGRIRGVLLYYHKITEYGIKCCMHAHHVVPRAPPGRGELYRRKTLFLADFPIFYFYPNGTWTHPPTSKLFLDFLEFF